MSNPKEMGIVTIIATMEMEILKIFLCICNDFFNIIRIKFEIT